MSNNACGDIISSLHKVSTIDALKVSMSLFSTSFEHSALKNLLSSINALATASVKICLATKGNNFCKIT
jgi:hypothetical protein